MAAAVFINGDSNGKGRCGQGQTRVQGQGRKGGNNGGKGSKGVSNGKGSKSEGNGKGKDGGGEGGKGEGG
jgi:hypothetical protein